MNPDFHVWCYPFTFFIFKPLPVDIDKKKIETVQPLLSSLAELLELFPKQADPTLDPVK